MVLANRLAYDNATARQAHDRLLTKLGDVIQLMREALAAARDLSPAGPAEHNRTVDEDLAWIEEKFGRRWQSGSPHPLLDELVIDPATDEAFDECRRRWHAIDEWGPRQRDVSDAELCGLRRIIDQIACETGVSFSAYRIVYGTEDPIPGGL